MDRDSGGQTRLGRSSPPLRKWFRFQERWSPGFSGKKIGTVVASMLPRRTQPATDELEFRRCTVKSSAMRG